MKLREKKPWDAFDQHSRPDTLTKQFNQFTVCGKPFTETVVRPLIIFTSCICNLNFLSPRCSCFMVKTSSSWSEIVCFIQSVSLMALCWYMISSSYYTHFLWMALIIRLTDMLTDFVWPFYSCKIFTRARHHDETIILHHAANTSIYIWNLIQGIKDITINLLGWRKTFTSILT